MKSLLLIISLCLTANVIAAQEEERYTEEEIAAIDEFMAAQVEVYMGRYDKAIPMLMDIHKKDRQNGMVVFELAKAYEATEDYSNADKYGEIATRLLPDNIWVKLYYGKLMIRMEKYEEGAEMFKQLSSLDPSDQSHVENYAKCLINSRQQNDALKALQNWEKLNGVNERLSRLMYQIYVNKNDASGAERELVKLADAFPGDTRILNNLATFYINKGEKEKAKKIYETILEVNPNHTEANAAMIAISPEEDTDGPFLRTLLPIIERQDVNIDLKVKSLIPYVEEYAENVDQASGEALLQLTETLTLIHPEEAKAHSVRGDVLFLSGDKMAAIKSYQKTLDLDDTNYMVWLQLMQSLDEENQLKELASVSMDAIDFFPNKVDAYYYYALAENGQGNTSNAMDYLQEAMLIAGRDLKLKNDLMSEMARSYMIEGNLARAQSTIDQALSESAEKNPNALEVKGDILAAEGKRAEAITFWKKAQDLGSTRKSLLTKLNQ
ncbi:MAG: tetratricopeptide repeat protein [Saprospiraceae bacterium]|nr:tetratricopeptide repeat protein [Saprospiraceae bacterium]